MSYVIVGGVCLVVGGIVGVFATALVTINKNTDNLKLEEDKDE